MSNNNQNSQEEVFKSIGRLDEATHAMENDIKNAHKEEDQIISFFTVVGKIIKEIIAK